MAGAHQSFLGHWTHNRISFGQILAIAMEYPIYPSSPRFSLVVLLTGLCLGGLCAINRAQQASPHHSTANYSSTKEPRTKQASTAGRVDPQAATAQQPQKSPGNSANRKTDQHNLQEDPQQAAGYQPSAERGYRLLRTKAYLPPDFTQEQFENLWTVWPAEKRQAAKSATPEQRREMIFREYGFAEPNDDLGSTALGYVEHPLEGGSFGWAMNCFSCHGGQVAGRTIPGAPNTHYALQLLTEDLARLKLLRGEPLGHMEQGALLIPLGTSRGTTNAVVFGLMVLHYRDKNLDFVPKASLPTVLNHDMDAPPFWHLKKKKSLYIDGFSPKNHRVIMQFTMLPEYSGAKLRGWENEFRDILAWLEQVQPPKYPGKIDEALAKQGEVVFRQSCSECHGTYGPQGRYPERLVDLSVIGTDPLRLKSLPVEHRKFYGSMWLCHYGADPVKEDPGGYVAPPLDGIWATAPYLHNGSVPTLWHLLHPDQRPSCWKRSSQDGFDHDKMGLPIKTFPKLPAGLTRRERWEYFDTTKPGKKASGHDFPAALSLEERKALLEYLKTL